MNKYFTLFLLITVGFSSVAQKLEKVKGNKEVIDIYQDLEPFTSLEISNDLEVIIKQGAQNSYHLETDSNLVEHIAFEVTEEKLHIYTLSTIQSNKKLNINLNVTSLVQLTLNDRAELTGLNKIESDSLSIITLDDSVFKLDVTSPSLSIIMNGDSKGDLAVKGGKLAATLNGNSTLKGDLTLETCELEVNERSDFDMDGDLVDFVITTNESANVKASTLRSENCNITAAANSDITVNATKNFTLYAQGKSTIYLYGNPEITIEGFKDTSRLLKK